MGVHAAHLCRPEDPHFTGGTVRAGLPKGSVLQLILHADSHISPILTSYRESRTVDDIMVRTSTEQIVRFMDAGRSGLAACSHIPVRNFRLFVAVKLPGDSPEVPRPEQFADRNRTKPLQDIRRQLAETLRAALLSPRPLRPEAPARVGPAAVQPLPGRLPGAEPVDL